MHAFKGTRACEWLMGVINKLDAAPAALTLE
jgi:hypothetical protein